MRLEEPQDMQTKQKMSILNKSENAKEQTIHDILKTLHKDLDLRERWLGIRIF